MLHDKEIINILWTGGWDSSYRIVELSRKNIIIQPIYVYGEGRISEKYEIRAMQIIQKILRAKEQTKAVFRPVKYIHFASLQNNKDISNAYKTISHEIHLGEQYKWLPVLALNYSNLEIGIEKAPPEQSGAINAIYNYGKLKYLQEKDTYVLDLENR